MNKSARFNQIFSLKFLTTALLSLILLEQSISNHSAFADQNLNPLTKETQAAASYLPDNVPISTLATPRIPVSGHVASTGISSFGLQSETSTSQVEILKNSNKLLVKFQNGVSESEKIRLRASAGVSKVQFSSLLKNYEFWNIETRTALTTSAVLTLSSSKNVQSIYPDKIVKIARTPNDPDYSKTWGMPRINAPAAWSRNTGSSQVTVAVIDTGILMNHPDLSENIWSNTFEVNGVAGFDDDQNGYVDDFNGWNFVGPNAGNPISNNDPTDDNGHGTHVAGIIGAVGNNGIGIAGVNWNVKLMPLKICDSNGSCSLIAAIQALEYAVTKGVLISNNSYGGSEYAPFGVAIENAGLAGHLFLAAAGNNVNDNDSAYPFFPASYDFENVLSVASISSNGLRSWFSNFGVNTVDIAAPGESILSTYVNSGAPTYEYLSGTSMATPYVAGAAALVAAAWLNVGHSWTVKEMKDRLLVSSTPNLLMNDLVSSGGILNLDTATNLEPALYSIVHIHQTGTGTGVVNSVYGSCSVRNCRLDPKAAQGSQVTLTAVPSQGSTFQGWSGACVGTATCVVTLNELTSYKVYASFKGEVPNGSSVQILNSVSKAIPIPVAPQPWGQFIKTFLSKDGNTRAVARRYYSAQSGGACYYLDSFTDGKRDWPTGGITVEKLLSGAWVEDGPEIIPPPKLGDEPATRWYNCGSFGYNVALSRNGDRMVVNLFASYDPFYRPSNPSMCAAVVYDRKSSGWEQTALLKPANYSECWNPAVGNPGWLESDWRDISISDDGTRVFVGGTTRIRVFDLVQGAWIISATINLPTRGSACSIFDSSPTVSAGDGKTVAIAFPACNPISPGWYAGLVWIYKYSAGAWSQVYEIKPNDGNTIGTMHFGMNLAFDLVGTTLVVTYGRNWASVADDTNWRGAAWVYEFLNSKWTKVREITNPYPLKHQWYQDRILSCTILSDDGSRLICGAPTDWANQKMMGWFQVLDRLGPSWMNTISTKFLFDPDALPWEQLSSNSAAGDVTNFYAGLSWSAITSGQYGENRVGTVVTPGQPDRIPQVTLSIRNTTLTSPANRSITLSTSGGSGTGVVSYTATGSGCSISGSILSVSQVTSCAVVATKAASGIYASASSASVNFTFSAVSQSSFRISNAAKSAAAGTTIALTSLGGSGDGLVTYSTNDPGCTVSNSSLSSSQVGRCTVVATKAAQGIYSAISSTPTTFTFTAATQETLTISNTTLTTLASSVVTLTTSGGSGDGAVTYRASGSGCSVASATLTAARATTCSVTATKAASGIYKATNSAVVRFTFTLAPQESLSINNSPITGSAGTPITLTTAGGSGAGAVRFTLAPSAGCRLSGTTLNATTPASCTVSATKAANGVYAATTSPPVTFTFSAIAQAPLTISNLVTSVQKGRRITLTTTGGSGSGRVTFAVISGGCTLTGASLTSNTATICRISATKAAAGIYSQASSENKDFTFIN